MSIKAIKSVNIESVTLDTSKDKNSAIKSSMSVFPSVLINPTAGHGKGSDFSKIRLRVIVSYGKHSCEVIDYLSQRINEYKQLGDASSQFKTSVEPSKFISFLKTDLAAKSFDEKCKDPYDYLEEKSPVSPFSTKKEVIESVFKERYVYEGDGKKLPPATVMFDAPLVELVSSKISTALNDGDYSLIGNEPLSIDPINFKFKEKSFEKNPQLSVYAYAYELPAEKTTVDQISLTTGMSPVISYTLAGAKTNWRAITLENPMIGIGYKEPTSGYPQTTTETAPDQNKLIVFNSFSNSMVFMKSLLELQQNLYNPNVSPLLKRRNGIQKVVKKGNYFSNLWLTKDSEENKRFMFGFDLQSYLAEKSHFPYLYTFGPSASQIIDGSGLMDRQTPSYIMNMEVKRIFIDPPSLLPINMLGTSGYSTKLEPSKSYPKKRIFHLKKVQNLALDRVPDLGSAGDRHHFYEGKDILDKDQDLDTRQDGAYRYGVDFTVYDGSVIFVREALKEVMLNHRILQELYEVIVASPFVPFYKRQSTSDLRNIYDSESGYLKVRAENVVLYSKNNNKNQTLASHLGEILQEYDKIVSYFLRENNASMYQYFSERLLDNDSYIDLSIVAELIRYMNMFVHLLYRRLSEFFPTNPLGRDIPSLEKNDFQSRGILEFRAPFLRDEYYFDKKVTMGKDYGFGVDYITNKERNPNYQGLTKIGIRDFKLRAGMEIAKYFTLPEGENNNAQILYDGLGLSLGDATQRYMTPYVIRVPNREPLAQVNIGQDRGRGYPLDRYAQLFVDVFRHKSLIHPGGMHDPLIIDSDSTLEKNDRLYNSVIKLLQEQHEVTISEKTDFTYPSLDVLTGKQLKTTAVDDLEEQNRLITAGPKAIPTIIGGDTETNTTTKTYITAVDTSLTSEYSINKEGYVDSKLKKQDQKSRPVKLPFAIFGELSVDPQINFSIKYQQEMFNSMKQLSNQLELGTDNINSFLSLPGASNIPAPIKSMLIIAATKTVNNIFNSGADATRPTLEDQDSNTADNNISVKIFGDGNEYQATGDPMKIYAKFMAFWMNYKQTIVVEYLSGFDGLRPTSGDLIDNSTNGELFRKLKRPRWTPLTREMVNRIEKEQTQILCRVRNYTLEEYIKDLLPPATTTVHALSTNVKKLLEDYDKQVFDFPVYNEYFMLGPDVEEQETDTQPLKKTSENECHEHTYYVDAKGNGWTSVAEHPESQDVKHKHQILNFVVQSAQSDCYPECEVKYGVKGAPPHIHKLLGEVRNDSSSTTSQSSTSTMSTMTSPPSTSTTGGTY